MKYARIRRCVSWSAYLDAADAANYARNDIACSKYYNINTQRTFYSVYRISSLQDLGRWGFSNFNQCQAAVKYSRGDLFCNTYVKSPSDSGFSLWSIRSNTDVGTIFYRDMGACLQQLGVKNEINSEEKSLNIAEEK